MSIKNLIHSIDGNIDYNNFAEEVDIIKENSSGEGLSVYDVKNKNGVTFYRVPGGAGIKEKGFLGFINGDRGRPALVGGSAKTNNTLSNASTPWTEFVDLTP